MGFFWDVRFGGVYWDKSESVYYVFLKKSYWFFFWEKDELMDEIKEDEVVMDMLIVLIDKESI